MDALFARPGVLTVLSSALLISNLRATWIASSLSSALLISNLRATWIASSWKPDSEAAALPRRFAGTWGDKFADKLPVFHPPKARVPYYVFSGGLLLFILFGLAVRVSRRVSQERRDAVNLPGAKEQFLNSHSCRNACNGSVRMARRAGM
jgi:hypothetical protein